jgi:hypothetical protein
MLAQRRVFPWFFAREAIDHQVQLPWVPGVDPEFSPCVLARLASWTPELHGNQDLKENRIKRHQQRCIF